jgi:hypothetical protein
LTYGKGEVKGYKSSDRVFLDKNKQNGLWRFQFVLGDQMSDLKGIDGIIGFSRNSFIEPGKISDS